MGRMAIPTMDVVRFKEDDIIVASNVDKHAFLSGWGNNVSGDALLVFTNGHRNEHTWSELVLGVEDNTLNKSLSFTNDNGDTVTLGTLASDESKYGAWNGEYESHDGGDTWNWFNRQ